MWLTYKQVLRLIFPPSADERLLDALPPDYFTKHQPVLRHGVTTLLPFADPYVRAAIHLAKFHHHHTAIHELGSAVAAYCKSHPVDCIVPIPLSRKRYHERGYNQVVEILAAAKRRTPAITYSENLLVRTRHTQPQTELTRNERLTNVEAAFAVRPAHILAPIENLTILLIDDVVTTGSTLKAARATLAPLRPKSITCLALAG